MCAKVIPYSPATKGRDVTIAAHEEIFRLSYQRLDVVDVGLDLLGDRGVPVEEVEPREARVVAGRDALTCVGVGRAFVAPAAAAQGPVDAHSGVVAETAVLNPARRLVSNGPRWGRRLTGLSAERLSAAP